MADSNMAKKRGSGTITSLSKVNEISSHIPPSPPPTVSHTALDAATQNGGYVGVRWDSGKEEDCVFTGDGGDYQLVLCSDEANQSLNMSRASSSDSKDYTLDQTSLNVGVPSMLSST